MITMIFTICTNVINIVLHTFTYADVMDMLINCLTENIHRLLEKLIKR